MCQLGGWPNGLDTLRAKWAGRAAAQMDQVRGGPNGPGVRRARCAAGQKGLVRGGQNEPDVRRAEWHSTPSWQVATALASVPSHVLPIVSR